LFEQHHFAAAAGDLLAELVDRAASELDGAGGSAERGYLDREAQPVADKRGFCETECLRRPKRPSPGKLVADEPREERGVGHAVRDAPPEAGFLGVAGVDVERVAVAAELGEGRHQRVVDVDLDLGAVADLPPVKFWLRQFAYISGD
jgi:hypothetical protein